MISESKRNIDIDGNENKSNSNIILSYIKSNFALGQPIFTREIYQVFPTMRRGSIRQILSRLVEQKIIERAEQGIYFKPKSKRLIASNHLSSQRIIEDKYLKNKNRVGYITGINLANRLGLTQQIANVETIKSNNVSNKKRKVNINKGKVIINAPRVKVNDENYKLLQILDVLNDFERLSEIDLASATPVIWDYLKDLKLSKEEIDRCVDAYPLKAQVNFFKTGVYHELIKK